MTNTYTVFTFRPALQNHIGAAVGAVKGTFDDVFDNLPATLTSAWEVEKVRTKEQAIACVIEHAAGKRTLVRKVA